MNLTGFRFGMQTIWRAVKISQQRRLCNYRSILCLSKTSRVKMWGPAVSRMQDQAWVPMKHNFHLLPTTGRNLGWIGVECCRGELSSIRSQSPSEQGSTSVNRITACVTAAVTWLTPVWAREWMERDRVTFLHEKLLDLGFSLCSCMYLVSPRPLLCAQ